MSVTAARGFTASGLHAGLRRKAKDLAVVCSELPATGAGMFTANRMAAPPVIVSRQHLGAAEPQAVVINSGSANAATGRQGELDARVTAGATAKLLGVAAEQVLVLSTGLIGVRLAIDKLLAGLAPAVAALSRDGGRDAAEAILTTDSGPKEAMVARDGFTVGAMAKGAGMIHPALATMLAVITTDYPLAAGEAIDCLRPAVDASFNRISVDGDCSTNDAVVLLANGASGVRRDTERDASFVAALREVCADLARRIVADGEGATVVLEVSVTGAASDTEGAAIARRVATSQLVKTAAFGRDANWGRVLAAAGSAVWNGGFARLDPERLTLAFNGTRIYADGAALSATPDLTGPCCRIDLDLGLGNGAAAYLASDLTFDYVRINAEYRT